MKSGEELADDVVGKWLATAQSARGERKTVSKIKPIFSGVSLWGVKIKTTSL